MEGGPIPSSVCPPGERARGVQGFSLPFSGIQQDLLEIDLFSCVNPYTRHYPENAHLMTPLFTISLTNTDTCHFQVKENYGHSTATEKILHPFPV